MLLSHLLFLQVLILRALINILSCKSCLRICYLDISICDMLWEGYYMILNARLFKCFILCISLKPLYQFSSVQSLSPVRLVPTPWIAAHQVSLSITSSQSLLKLMSMESVMPSNHLILCRPLLLLPPIPASESFPMSQLFAWGGQRTGVSALASFLPKNTQDQSSWLLVLKLGG